jgi:anti-sigma B factor antagonist
MKLKTEIADVEKNIHVLSIAGRIKIGNLEPVEKEFERLAGLRAVKLIVDVQNIDAIDSSGIGELIKGRTQLAENGGNMVLLGSGSKVEMVIKLSGLMNYFPIATTQAEAIELLNRPPQINTTESSDPASNPE